MEDAALLKKLRRDPDAGMELLTEQYAGCGVGAVFCENTVTHCFTPYVKGDLEKCSKSPFL